MSDSMDKPDPGPAKRWGGCMEGSQGEDRRPQ